MWPTLDPRPSSYQRWAPDCSYDLSSPPLNFLVVKRVQCKCLLCRVKWCVRMAWQHAWHMANANIYGTRFWSSVGTYIVICSWGHQFPNADPKPHRSTAMLRDLLFIITSLSSLYYFFFISTPTHEILIARANCLFMWYGPSENQNYSNIQGIFFTPSRANFLSRDEILLVYAPFILFPHTEGSELKFTASICT